MDCQYLNMYCDQKRRMRRRQQGRMQDEFAKQFSEKQQIVCLIEGIDGGDVETWIKRGNKR